MIGGGTDDKQYDHLMSEKIGTTYNHSLGKQFVRNVESGKFLIKRCNRYMNMYIVFVNLWPAKESSDTLDGLIRGGSDDKQYDNSMSEKPGQTQNRSLVNSLSEMLSLVSFH